MKSKSTKRSPYRARVEQLEARELLSSTRSTIPIAGVHFAASRLPITIQLDPRSNPAGDYVNLLGPTVSLSGQTAPRARVVLKHSTATGKLVSVATTRANDQGQYAFHLRCAKGTTTMTVVATSAGGSPSTASMTVTRANQVIVWNSVALQMIRNVQSPPPDSARQLAILGVSVFDAVNAIHPRYASYDIAVKAPHSASADAAAASAAYTALVGVFPSQKPILDAELATSLAAIPDGRAKAQGVALGASVATQILSLRANDGSTTQVVYDPTPGPGVWVPTPPNYAPPIDPQWGQVTPFALSSGGQFQPPPPPAINSPDYAAAYNQVEAIGGTNSTTRTAEQTAIANFWSDQTGHTFDPPGHWNQIAEIVAAGKNTSLENSARTFALLNMALADAGIASWNVKYTDNTWRPVTAIRAGDAGVNPLVTGDPTWTPLWPTPPFPSYVSGHSTFSAAAAAVLDSIYGTDVAFTDPGDPSLHLTPRHYAGFDQAAQEAGISRIYGGIHFSFDNTAGLALGTQVGNYVISHELAALRTS